MTHRLAGILSDYLSREQMIEKDEADIYQYGLEIFMDGVLETLLLVVLGILWGRFWQSICFIVSFTVLRSFTGGYHCSHKGKMCRCYGRIVHIESDSSGGTEQSFYSSASAGGCRYGNHLVARSGAACQ